MNQYIHDNTDDEISHAAFLNAYLASKGAPTVNLDQFRTLPSSQADGARQIVRLTNLTQLTIDTSFWSRYRSTTNIDVDSSVKFARAVPSLSVGRHTAIPRTNADTNDFHPQPGKNPFIPTHLQAIANTAAFHFVFIEQGGTSLYPTLAQKVTSLEVLRILLSIGPSETMHFQTWQDKAGNAPALTDTDTGFPGSTGATVTFVDLSTNQPETLQANLIMPEPCDFLSKSLPQCAIIRPTSTPNSGAVAAINGFAADGLFIGQSQEFLQFVMELAQAADAATRQV